MKTKLIESYNDDVIVYNIPNNIPDSVLLNAVRDELTRRHTKEYENCSVVDYGYPITSWLNLRIYTNAEINKLYEKRFGDYTIPEDTIEVNWDDIK